MPLEGARGLLGGRGIDDTVSSHASKVLPVGSPAALRWVRIDDAFRRAIFREFRQPVSELVAIEVGTFGWSGFNGYKGWALVLHTSNERRLVYHSLYCSRRRLMTWASTIRGSDVFVGELRTTNRQQRWGGPNNYPVV